MSIRLLIADDHAVVRAGITALLCETDIAVVAAACNGAEALQMARKQRPDVVLLDVRMPEFDGMACLSKLRVEFPDTPIIMFSAYKNPTYIARAVALGATGYVTKSVTGQELIEAIRSGAAGESLWSSDELRAVSGSLTSARLESVFDVPLTKREGEVLKQLALGLSNKEIAQALSISYETVKEHVQHVLRKLGVSDRTQAAVWAVRNGLV
ncbi:response regulator [Bythopirellula polymerisocia]|uniref:Response regulator protein VraR n=1 Tax=Bythopirellula polymerisocia TaxID=2528003 RepID=A0A5C6CFL6_9BACT|nr:response regulator transcription factor [Bythopirellula polymerisocia]TWU23703.1 Response regulator protein VraR [Bythopirellula polymerisocia]